MPKDIFDDNNIQLDNSSSRDIFDENGISVIPSAPKVPQGALDKVFNSSLFQGLLGAGDAARNFLSDTANLIPGVHINPVKNGQGLAYDVGNIGGDVGTFLAGGEALDTLRAASEGLPAIGKAASYLGKEGLPDLLKTVGGGTAFGAITNPANRTQGAVIGGGLGALSKASPLISSIIRKFNPEIAAQDAIEGITQKGAEEKLKSRALYNQVIDQFGDTPIYSKQIGASENVSGGLNSLKSSIIKRAQVKPIYDQYIANPTVRNAHQLQSQLGFLSRSLKGTDWTTGLIKDNIESTREQLTNAIKDSLKNVSPNAADTYQQAGEHYLTKVIPYQKLSQALENLNDPTPKQVLQTISKSIKKSFPKNKLGGIKSPIVPNDINALKENLAQIIKNKTGAQSFIKKAKPAIKYGSLGAGASLGGYGAKKLFGD